MQPSRSSLGLLLVAAVAAACVLPATGQPQPAGSSQACSSHCDQLHALPLAQWSELRSQPQLYEFPWQAGYAFQPLDYVALAEEVCACLAQAGGSAAAGGSGGPPPQSAFVSTNGTQFEVDGAPFRFMGFNHPQLVRYAAGDDPGRLQYLTDLLDRAAELGLRVVRTWAHFEGYDPREPGGTGEFSWLSLQMEPGRYNETTWQALDRVLYEASQRGMYVILSLSDFYGTFGTGQSGFEPYLQWMAGSLNITNFTVLDFYTEPRPRLLYQANLCRMVNRVNTITGVPYRLDPTIFAWEVMNEPRCPGCFNTSDEDGLFNWLAEVTSFLKCIDQNHLVSVGLEGHYGASSPWRFPDMPGAWALCQGQDYDRLLQLPAVDYGVAHAYEAMRGNWDEFRREYCGWEECILPWLGAWIRGHLNESRALGRPFLLEEFNYPYNETRRNQMFRMVQDIFRDDIAVHPDSAAAGAMFWLPALAGQPDTDGLNIYLDGTLAGPPPEGIYGEKQSAATTEFLGAVRRMEEDVRMRLPAQSCMDQAKLAYRAVYDLPGLKNYSSASTVELLAELAADSAAFAAEVAAELAGELAQHLAPAGTAPRPAAPLSPSAEAAGAAAAGPGPEGGPPGQAATCTGDPSASCEALGELPFDEWAEAQEALNASQAAASWAWPGASPLLPAVDWPAVAETVCNCLLEAAAAPPPSAPGGSVGAAADDTSSGFVRRQGNLLVLDGQPLFFVGFDAPALPQWAYRDWPGDLAAVDALFANASSLGFTVGRMFVPGEGRDLRLPTQRQLAEPFGDVWTSLQPEAGVFDEEVFRALDFVLDSAARHGIKLILVLGSTDSQLGLKDATFGIAAGTPLTYMQWAAGSLNVTGATMLDFYTDPRARLLFKNFLCTLASRANSFSGVAYRDDPTIFSWELLQAPRCPACPGPSKGTVLTEWAAEMAGFLKCIDGNHLVSVAQLGGFGDASPEVRATDNPALDTECDGADFLALTTLEAVDYGTMQMTDSYFGYDEATQSFCGWACHLPWFRRWLTSHIHDSQAALGKPLLVTSVSKTYHEDERSQLWELVGSVLGEARREAGPDSAAAGVFFATANVRNQTDWGGGSIYLDGSLPAPAPDRTFPYPPEEVAFLDAANLMREAFERRALLGDCQGRATALHMHFYNTTALKIYDSNSTVDIIAEMARLAEEGTF